MTFGGLTSRSHISMQIYKTKTKVQNKGSLLVFTAAPTEWGSLLSESQNYPGDSAESKNACLSRLSAASLGGLMTVFGIFPHSCPCSQLITSCPPYQAIQRYNLFSNFKIIPLKYLHYLRIMLSLHYRVSTMVLSRIYPAAWEWPGF